MKLKYFHDRHGMAENASLIERECSCLQLVETFSRLYSCVTKLSWSVMTLIREGISGSLIQEGISVVGLITQCPMWIAHEDMSRELTLNTIHYGS